MGNSTSHTPRSSDRVSITLAIRVFGSDVDGRAYSQEGRTVEISRGGALIIVSRKLIPEEEIMIRLERSGKEAPAQVVGEIRAEPEGFVYGVKILEPDANLWDIQFPPSDETEPAVMRILLECSKCHLREVVHLEEVEAEVYHTHRSIYHTCSRCRESTMWNEASYEAPARKEKEDTAPPMPSPPAESDQPPPVQPERRYSRVKCQLRACIRYHQHYEEEVLDADNVSRGGICFTTAKALRPGAQLEIAVPYSPGGANIFVPAAVVRVKAIPGKNRYEIGAAYVKR